MGAFTPIRDGGGGIVGMQPKDETLFAATLADTMTAVGATEPPEEAHAAPARAARRSYRLELAGIVGGLLLAVALIAGMNALAPAPAPRLPTVTAAPAPTSAPTPTVAPTDAPTATPEPSATPEPPPTPEPVIIIQAPPCDPQNPPYQVRQQVGDLGHVVGFSCDSVEEAQANADRLAAEMRAAAETR
jgi:hypothetical protein